MNSRRILADCLWMRPSIKSCINPVMVHDMALGNLHTVRFHLVQFSVHYWILPHTTEGLHRVSETGDAVGVLSWMEPHCLWTDGDPLSPSSVRRFEDLLAPYRLDTNQKEGQAEGGSQEQPWMVSEEEISRNKAKVTSWHSPCNTCCAHLKVRLWCYMWYYSAG